MQVYPLCKFTLGSLLVILLVLVSSPAAATLVFYYDPATGNVSFDTSDTRTEGLFTYGLSLNPYQTSLEFRHENMLRISSASTYMAQPTQLSDVSLSIPLEGLYTIGDILPPDLDESLWNTLFTGKFQSVPRADNPSMGGSSFVDALGQGPPPEPATFVYGAPDRDFDNKWDMVDPSTLDWATQASLIYDQGSGEVVLDTTGELGGYITSFVITTEQSFLFEEFTPFLDVPLVTAREQTIGIVADAIEPGSYSLGMILEPGLSATDFEELFTSAKYVGQAGFNGGSFVFETNGVGFQLLMVGASQPGDFNSDGIVDLADYTVWRDSLGATGAGHSADANGDLLVDSLDYEIWKSSFGQGTSAASPAVSVPEPSAWCLLLVGIAAFAGAGRFA